MERKDLFLNNDLSMMLSRELNPEPDFGKEWENEQKELREKAEAIIKKHSIDGDAKILMTKSAHYAGADEYYQKLYVEGSDDEQFKELRSLEYVASLTLLPDEVIIAGWNLIDGEDYGGWAELLYSLNYVPLQKAFCYCLTRRNDYIGVLNVLNIQRLAYPKTFIWSFLHHWFEWLTRVGGHLLTYSDEKGFFDKNATVQKLKAEAKTIKMEWEYDLPKMVNEMLEAFSKYLHPGQILAWVTREPLRNDATSNPYSDNYNRCLYLLCEDLSQVVNLKDVPEEDINLNMLLLMARKAVEGNDTGFGEYIYNKLTRTLLVENFSNMEKKSELDEGRQRVVAQLIILVFPKPDFAKLINDVATRFQGWNIDYQQVYYEARCEAYLVCSLFRIFEFKIFDEALRLSLWKNLVDLYVREYRRCENEYIMQDEFAAPFRTAIEIAERVQDENCREYLHNAVLESVLSIVSLLTIFSECDIHLSRKTIKRLLQRIEIEWPSAKMLMEVRGQKAKEARIEQLITHLRMS